MFDSVRGQFYLADHLIFFMFFFIPFYCYPGQEIVARIDSRGKFAKQLTGISISGNEIPKSGEKIQKAGKEIGWITSSAYSPKLSKPLALGFVAFDYLKPGTEVEILIDTKPVAGTVTQLPV